MDMAAAGAPEASILPVLPASAGFTASCRPDATPGPPPSSPSTPMKPPPFTYFRPGTLDEAISLLSRTENAKVLAGGQSLMAMLNLRYVFPDALVDINDLFDLAGIDI